jgi:hypothetical protein
VYGDLIDAIRYRFNLGKHNSPHSTGFGILVILQETPDLLFSKTTGYELDFRLFAIEV